MTQLRSRRSTVRAAALACWTLAAAATGLAFSYRVYLAHASGRMAAVGAREEALFALTIDPLWRVEVGIAKLLGNPGTLSVMNALGTLAWGSMCLASILVVRHLRTASRRSASARP